jgi:hypothetical protein
MFTGNREPTIAELLDDPVAKAVMRRDGVSEQYIWYCVEEARRRLLELLAPATAGSSERRAVA